MRLPLTEHTSRPWRIHELVPDFHVEDVWALATPGGPDDLDRLVELIVTDDFPAGAPLPVRFLWELRWQLGRVLRLDRPDNGLGKRVPSLRDRFPDDLRAAPVGPDLPDTPFRSLYLLHDEWAAELANRTVHGVLHLGWVPDRNGGFRGQMAVLVKPNGRFGDAYMAAIKPFRHTLVYPALLGRFERRWETRRSGSGTLAPAGGG